MPGPGKGKSKAKPKTTRPRGPNPSIVQDPFIDDVDNAQGWNMIVDILCDVYDIPDLTTRSGLKKVHANFGSIYRRLDNAYKKYSDNPKILGAIVGIFAKMCADSILRDKLFRAGLLSKLLPLLDEPSCRHLALRALTTVTHHGGVETRIEIAKKTPILIKLLQEHPDDPKVAELSIVTMTHAIGAVIAVEEKPDQKLVKSLDIPGVLRMVVDELRKPTASLYLFSHAIGMLSGATLHCWRDCQAFQPSVTFLVACLRSKDLSSRCDAVGGLIGLHCEEAEPDQRNNDPQKIMSAVRRGFPSHLSDVLMNYGPDQCDVFATLKCTGDHTKAMMQNAQDHDFYALGKVVSRLIPSTEFSMAEGMFQTDNPVTGEPESIDVGLPYTMWSDALPHAARALRASGVASDLDLADIVELKYLIIKSRIPDAVTLAKRAIKRSPEVAYFYYAITLGADAEQGLRYAKKGLRCKVITPFVQFALLHRAVDHAGNLGITVLASAHAGDKKWEEGVAFLMSACEDAKAFIESAPPDTRHMKNMLNWYIVLTLTIRGPDMSPDLTELQRAFKQVQISEEFSTFFGYPPPNTQLRLVRRTVVSLYPSAVKEWGPFISRFDGLLVHAHSDDLVEPPSTVKAEDDLAAWLDDMHMEGGEAHPERCSHPKISANSVALYRCSWCGNPSAVLRKCGGCAKTRYCDAGCQKSHWSVHKSVCKPN